MMIVQLVINYAFVYVKKLLKNFLFLFHLLNYISCHSIFLKYDLKRYDLIHRIYNNNKIYFDKLFLLINELFILIMKIFIYKFLKYFYLYFFLGFINYFRFIKYYIYLKINNNNNIFRYYKYIDILYINILIFFEKKKFKILIIEKKISCHNKLNEKFFLDLF